jgi:DNA-directed RNA polymerase specialized sigma24 family protein
MEKADRIERLLALMLVNQMKGASQAQKVYQLNLAGFTNLEIADILDTSTAVVRQMLYTSRKRNGGKKRKR